jgi:hypothetical protein
MKFFVAIALIIVICALVLGLTTDLNELDSASATRVLGMPVVAQGDATWSWLKVGGGPGVLFVGAAGYGVVVFGFIGAGLLLGTGQASAGLIAIGQAGLGIVAFLGQVGTGLVGAGQLVVGAFGWGQGRLAFDGQELITELNADLNDLLDPR